MFGGQFGGKCSQGVHFFDEDAHLFQAVSKLAELRRTFVALRRGRQYVHDISGDGAHFGPPTKLNDRLRALVAWSRVMADHELLVVFNTDELKKHEMYSTLNRDVRRESGELRLLFSYTPGSGVEPVESPRYAIPRLKVERRGNVLCTKLVLGPAGLAIYAAERFLTDAPPAQVTDIPDRFITFNSLFHFYGTGRRSLTSVLKTSVPRPLRIMSTDTFSAHV